MTQKVMLAFHGLQADQGGEDAGQIETVVSGDYYKRNDKHYVIYEEDTDGFEQPTKNRLKFNADMVELSRSGPINVHMVFRENKKNQTSYNTPFGQILMGIDTKRIQVTEQQNHIIVEVEYSLDVSGEFLSDCHMRIDIYSQNNSSPL